jgi:thiamine kinase-like enzyme
MLLEPTLARLDLLEEHWDLIETWCEGMPRTLVHGDFVGRNLRVRGGPDRSELVPCGWESAGWGVPAIDLAQASLQAKRLAAAPDLAAYASLLRAYGCGVSDEVVFRVSVCGKVFRCLSGLSQNKSAHHLRIYGSELAEAMGERGLSFCRSAPAPRAAASPG